MQSNSVLHQFKVSAILHYKILFSSWRNNIKKIALPKWGIHSLNFCGIIVLTIIILSVLFGSKSFFTPLNSSARKEEFVRCSPNEDSPVLVNLKTKMKVYYDGDQWFHMAETFSVQHSILKSQGRLIDGRRIWYNFDSANFADKLNAFTRFIVYVGTMTQGNDASVISFMYDPNLISVGTENALNRGDGILLSQRSLHAEQILQLGQEMNPNLRFSQVQNNEKDTNQVQLRENVADSSRRDFNSELEEDKVCFRFMGSIGGQFIPRDRWFPHLDDITSFREKIKKVCPVDDTLTQKYQKVKVYKLVIYQRDKTRYLMNCASVVEQLQRKLPVTWQIMVIMHDSNRSPCELSHILHDADVLVTPHGFQSILLLFLPTPALLYEIFPYPYYKMPYRLLAQSLGIAHASYTSEPTFTIFGTLKYFLDFSPSTCSKYYICRDLARRQNVILNEMGVSHLISTINHYQPLFAAYPAYTNLSFGDFHKLKYQPSKRESIYAHK